MSLLEEEEEQEMTRGRKTRHEELEHDRLCMRSAHHELEPEGVMVSVTTTAVMVCWLS